jgi:hypothetical protein
MCLQYTADTCGLILPRQLLILTSSKGHAVTLDILPARYMFFRVQLNSLTERFRFIHMTAVPHFFFLLSSIPACDYTGHQ